MDWEGFAERMATMARDLLAQESVEATLERITESAMDLVEGCDAAGILVLHGRRVETLAPTDGLVVRSDRLQERLGEGPCFDAARRLGGERVFRIKDFSQPEECWPDYVGQARDLGIGSMMGFLLYTEHENLGALNVYSRRPAAFTKASETAGWLLASHAAVAFSSARTADQLHQAVETRHTIGEAMGILMERLKITEDDAFALMRRVSQERNVKLRDIARQICESGGIDG
ncbi:ANTAR domain-containing protein [Streptomyces sp. SID8382]|uniref:GAF and ANTAR domain-containing protein n=1 Tax=Streptomyces malaysiensis TaxID=92644 RepID=UPI000C2C7C3A|nr:MULTISPECIES: GAF and ANTAR domain-containing protein [unclassified Streptomyces]AUA09778.1 anaerobic nitric oxide reductase transcription regulator [Streptomyces sp. M56]MYX54855.1 ANTAR domain-containing protein [Streptomyces sp. SID8382]